jgi:geranylgeranyl reductase family protein
VLRAEVPVDYDVIVVGAGPAGCAAAYDLAAAGQRVIVVDRFQFPRSKPCAGALSVKALTALRFSVAPVLRAVCRNLVVGLRTEKTRTLVGRDPICAMTVRSDLDAFVLSETRKRGAIFEQIGRIEAVAVDRDCVHLVTATREITARFLVGADGANSTVRRLTGDFPTALASFAMECSVDTSDAVDVQLDFGVVPGGYGWVFPKGDHLNVGVYTHLPQEGIVTLGGLRQYSSAKTGNSKLRNITGHAVGLGGTAYRPHSQRLFLVGDAAGLVDPLFGEGIYYAIVSGQAAAAAITHCCDDPMSALKFFRKRLAIIAQDLEICRKAANVFYGHLDRYYPLITSAISQHIVMKAFASGRTVGSICETFLTLPFMRAAKLDWHV